MTNKRYQEIIRSWNYEEVIHIEYKTEHARGYMEMSAEFLIEKYKKLLKVFKGVDILDISVVNESTGVVYIHLGDLFNAWLFAIGRRTYER